MSRKFLHIWSYSSFSRFSIKALVLSSHNPETTLSMPWCHVDTHIASRFTYNKCKGVVHEWRHTLGGKDQLFCGDSKQNLVCKDWRIWSTNCSKMFQNISIKAFLTYFFDRYKKYSGDKNFKSEALSSYYNVGIFGLDQVTPNIFVFILIA